MIEHSVWERTGYDTMNKNLYAFMVSFWTAAGIAASAVAAYMALSVTPTLWLFLGALVAGIAGVLISLKSDNPIVSLLGYALVAIPFGVITGPLIAMYTTASVVTIFFVTTAVVVGLGIIGAIIPQSLESWGAFLFGGLIILLVAMFGTIIAGFFGLPIATAWTILDWAGVLLFSAYVVYDLNRAMRVPYTMDNAIDCALAVYLDFINIFIRLLELFGKKDD